MHVHQAAGARWICDAPCGAAVGDAARPWQLGGGGVLGDDPGLGQTMQVLAVVEALVASRAGGSACEASASGLTGADRRWRRRCVPGCGRHGGTGSGQVVSLHVRDCPPDRIVILACSNNTMHVKSASAAALGHTAPSACSLIVVGRRGRAPGPRAGPRRSAAGRAGRGRRGSAGRIQARAVSALIAATARDSYCMSN